MSATIIPIRGFGDDDPGRFDAFHNRTVDTNALAGELGTPAQWTASAIAHLGMAICSPDEPGAATVSVAALKLVLAHIEQLEGHGRPGGGA